MLTESVNIVHSKYSKTRKLPEDNSNKPERIMNQRNTHLSKKKLLRSSSNKLNNFR